MTLDELESYEDFGSYLRERLAALTGVADVAVGGGDAAALPGTWREEGLALLAVGMLG